MKEKAILFGSASSLVGIVTEPSLAPRGRTLPAVVILSAGILHRVGPNRLYVKMARALAATGFVVFRFDFSGIGDSSIRCDSAPFEKSAVSETQEAMSLLVSTMNIETFVLMGICSGADVAFKTACCDDRVAGIVGINGYYLEEYPAKKLRSYVKRRIQRSYYLNRLLNYKSWWRVIAGRSNFQSIGRFVVSEIRTWLSRHWQRLPKRYPSSRWRLLIEGGIDLFLVYSDGSPAVDTYRVALEDMLISSGLDRKLRVEVIEDTDHVFTLLRRQEILLDLMRQWAERTKQRWLLEQVS